MRLITIYLIAYFLLLVGAGLVLWYSGILAEIPITWLAIVTVAAVGFGIVLALASGTRAVVREP